MQSPPDPWSPAVMHGSEPVTPGSGPEVIRLRETGLGIYTSPGLGPRDALSLMRSLAIAPPNPRLPTDNPEGT